MKLSEPKVVTFLIAVAIAVLALIGVLVTIPFVTANAFWVLFIGFVLLALANLLKGL